MGFGTMFSPPFGAIFLDIFQPPEASPSKSKRLGRQQKNLGRFLSIKLYFGMPVSPSSLSAAIVKVMGWYTKHGDD